MELVVELGEGFSGDDVVVTVDGREVWSATGVTTNWSVGQADVVRIPADLSGSSTVEVRTRGARAAHAVPTTADAAPRLRADLGPDGDLRITPADEEPIF